jgi:hypothetical protein
MRPQEFPGLPRTRTGLAVVATALYTLLVFFAWYAPIDTKAPLVLVFGSQNRVREVAQTFVQGLFWPLVAILAITALQASIEYCRKKSA